MHTWLCWESLPLKVGRHRCHSGAVVRILAIWNCSNSFTKPQLHWCGKFECEPSATIFLLVPQSWAQGVFDSHLWQTYTIPSEFSDIHTWTSPWLADHARQIAAWTTHTRTPDLPSTTSQIHIPSLLVMVSQAWAPHLIFLDWINYSHLCWQVKRYLNFKPDMLLISGPVHNIFKWRKLALVSVV